LDIDLRLVVLLDLGVPHLEWGPLLDLYLIFGPINSLTVSDTKAFLAANLLLELKLIIQKLLPGI
jgi:hypothetical protein